MTAGLQDTGCVVQYSHVTTTVFPGF